MLQSAKIPASIPLPPDQTLERPVKLSTRNLWKVYSRDGRKPPAIGDTIDEAALADMKQKGFVPALAGVSFDIREGEIFVIMGLSGSGKSTLVRCLSRLVEPSCGQILFNGEDLIVANPSRLIDIRRHAMGMVFQHFGLLPHLTVLENVAFPLRVQGLAREKRERLAREMIALVGLEERATHMPHELSGGQRQRVGIARSLVVKPELWFLDEPFSALDPLIRRQMQNEFLRLQKLLDRTIVFITHDIHEAFRLADRIAVMRDGKIVQIGTPADIALRPADGYVANFMEDVALTHVLTVGDLASGPEGECCEGLPELAGDAALDDAMRLFMTGTERLRVAGTNRVLTKDVAAQVFAGCRQTESEA